MLIPGSGCSYINFLWWRTCIGKLDNLSSCCYPQARLVRFFGHALCTSCAVPVQVAYAHSLRFCVIPMSFSYTQDLPPNDTSLCLGTEMVEISRKKARFFSLDWKREWQDLETLTFKGIFISFLLGLSHLSSPWAWVP